MKSTKMKDIGRLVFLPWHILMIIGDSLFFQRDLVKHDIKRVKWVFK